ncbi:MAG: hypothetical protein ABIP55_06780 [Tepidisphaeraceae bacterium]
MQRLASFLVALLLTITFASPTSAGEAKWFKGNLHTHSLWSDGDDFPEMIADWYKSQGYEFLALSDHNVLSVGERWVAIRDIRPKAGDLAMRKYRLRFPDVVQTRDAGNGEEVRLQPLTKVKELLEAPGKFLLIQSEEISDRFIDTVDGKATTRPIHLNAANIAEAIKPQGGKSVREVIANNFRAVEEQAKRLDRPVFTHLNHPNFGWGVTAADLAAVVEEHYFEVFNGHPLVHQLGDEKHPSIEKLFDIVCTIRLAQLDAEPVRGLATDDAHNYHVPGMKRSTAGRGWVMVRAGALTSEAIIDAMKAGEFYSSSGVTLKDVGYDAASRKLSIEIAPDGDATYATHFIGTPKNFADGGKTPLDSDKVGTIFATIEGTRPSYTLKGDELYVRAVITSNKPPKNPGWEAQRQQAWVQPVGWKKK